MFTKTFMLLFLGFLVIYSQSSDLLVWYPFNGTAKDFSTKGLDGIPTNGVIPSTDRKNHKDSAMSFNGSTGYVITKAIVEVPVDSLIAWYPFNGNANDMSGNVNHGVISNATVTTDRNGNQSAYYFNGTNSTITAASTPGFQRSNNRTVCAWVVSTATQEAGIAGYIGSITGHDGYLLMLKSNGRFAMIEDNYNNGVGGWDGPVSNLSYGGDCIWHHIAGVRRNDTTWLYVDGVKQSEYTVRSATVFPASIMMIGASSTVHAQYFKGKIDDVRFYSLALSDSAVMDLTKSKRSTPKLILGKNPFTISAWVYCQDSTSSKVLMGQNNNGALGGWSLALKGRQVVWVQQGVTSLLGNNISLNKWSHVVITRTPSGMNYDDMAFFVDNIYIGTDNLMDDPDYNLDAPLTLGASVSTSGIKRDFLKGSLDDVRIYNRVLKDSEIDYLYTGGLTKINSIKIKPITTEVSYTLPTTSLVNLILYSANGRAVEQVYKGVRQAGTYRFVYNKELASGSYFWCLKTSDQNVVRRIIIR